MSDEDGSDNTGLPSLALRCGFELHRRHPLMFNTLEAFWFSALMKPLRSFEIL